MLGVDVSDNNTGIDWYNLSGSVDFAIVKATENSDYTSTALVQQVLGAREHGMEVAFYHFARPNRSPWALQAQFFANTIYPHSYSGTPIAIDLEDGTGDLTEWVLNFASAIEVLCGRVPMLYSSPSFIAEHLRPVPELARLPLWLADWGVKDPVAPEPWSEVTIHQFSDRYVAPRTRLPLDGDRYLLGGAEQFRDIGAGMATVNVERVRIFLRETRDTLRGWSAELAAGMPAERQREVSSQMITRATEAEDTAAAL